MKEVHFLGDFRNCYTRHYHPVRAFSFELSQIGISTRFYPNINIPGIKDCDVLVIFDDGYKNLLPLEVRANNRSYEYLRRFLEDFDKVIWFDDNDSSGGLHPQIFPFVNIYAKSQVMRDLSYYEDNHEVGAYHRDFVVKFDPFLDHQEVQSAISKFDIKKIVLSWNLSLINWRYYNSDSKILKLIYLLHPTKFLITEQGPDFINKSKQLVFRGRMWEKDPSIGWWRKITLEQINIINRIYSKDFINPQPLLNRKRYRQEIANSLVVPSPFGKGEICYRDFECFAQGSLLFKPRMSHMRTWPDLYKENETYIAFEWDFSDFQEKLDPILTYPHRYQDIAQEGLKRFKSAVSNGSQFAEHFQSILDQL